MTIITNCYIGTARTSTAEFVCSPPIGADFIASSFLSGSKLCRSGAAFSGRHRVKQQNHKSRFAIMLSRSMKGPGLFDNVERDMDITLELRAQDAEPFLRQSAEDAAKYGAFCDHFTRRTVSGPFDHTNFDERRKEWLARFLRAKRIVEAFGAEYDPTSEEETLGVYIPTKTLKSHLVTVAGMTFRHVDEHEPDPKNARPSYKNAIHAEACRQAADRVVRRWRAALIALKAA